MSTEARRHTIDLRVRYAETDQMGVVYHANYLVWCDMGRTELIRDLGASYAEMEREGLILAVAEASLRYHASARYDDAVRVETAVEEVRSRTLAFRYTISRREDDGSLTRLATARTVLIGLDPHSRPRTFPSEIQELFRDAR